MQDSETRHKLVKANKELRELECGGEMRHGRDIDTVKADIEQLRRQMEFEEWVALVNRKDVLRAELVQADIDREVARLQLRAAEKRYNDLRTAASNVEFQLSLRENDQRQAVA